MPDTPDAGYTPLCDEAYAAMRRGSLAEASRGFQALLEHEPDRHAFHYMRGLAHKYLLDWPTSLRHNLESIARASEFDEASHWNAAIAATALGDWPRARQLWNACGIGIPEGTGPIEHDFGVAVARLHPWHGGETVWVRRIDPVRGRLLNVPLPESGHRFGDIVLHDGAAVGHRHSGDRQVPVFNALLRLTPSDFQTFVAFVQCDGPDALAALRDTTMPGLGHLEDWTSGIVHYCMRCSYGAPHRHDAAGDADGAWNRQRTLGIAAQSRHVARKLLDDWCAGGAGRSVDAIEVRECAVPAREDGHVWWRAPEQDDPA